MHKQEGFSLIEVLVTVAIVAVLAGVAIPNYSNYVVRAQLTEAHTYLADYRTRMEQFYQDNRSYASATACGVATATTSMKNFSATCVSAGQTFTATVTGNSGSPASGFAYTIDNRGQRTTSAVPSGWSLPSPNTCWARKKGGEC
jgi:type IV pilus assembly protein PilE